MIELKTDSTEYEIGNSTCARIHSPYFNVGDMKSQDRRVIIQSLSNDTFAIFHTNFYG